MKAVATRYARSRAQISRTPCTSIDLGPVATGLSLATSLRHSCRGEREAKTAGEFEREEHIRAAHVTEYRMEHEWNKGRNVKELRKQKWTR